MQNKENTEGKKIDSLTGLRALAATMVVLGHIVNYQILGNWWFLKYGWAGVNIFFVLSGFLFTYLYLDKFTEGTQSLKEFFLKRIFRIYPSYIVVLSITIFTRLGQYSIWDIISHLTMTHAYFANYRQSINIPAWTLSVEEFFYLIIPFLLYLFGKIYNNIFPNSKKLKFSTILLLYFILSYAGYDFIQYVIRFQRLILGFTPPDNSLVSSTVFSRYNDFGLGIVIGFIALKYPNSFIFKNRLFSNFSFILGAASFLGLSYLVEINGGTNKNTGNEFIYYWAMSHYNIAAFFIIISLIGNSIFNKLFSTRIMVYLGQISFALYLIHYVNIWSYNDMASFVKYVLRYTFNSEPVAVIVTMFIVNYAAAILYHLVEHPAQDYLRRKFIKST